MTNTPQPLLPLDLQPPPDLLILEKYKDADPEQVLLDEEETNILTETSPKTREAWRHQGRELPFVKLGRRIKYRLSDVLAYRNRIFRSTREALTRNRTAWRVQG